VSSVLAVVLGEGGHALLGGEQPCVLNSSVEVEKSATELVGKHGVGTTSRLKCTYLRS
jgi:hypothetical protein